MTNKLPKLKLLAYLDSGLLELYALNSLPDDEKRGVERMLATYPELRKELREIEDALESYATSRWITPPAHLEQTIIDSLTNLQKEKELDLNDLPLINKFSDYRNWLPMVQSFGELPLSENGRHMKLLRHDDSVTQILVVSTTDIEEETHENEHESFLILSGECKCTVGNEIRLMGPGDFMEIPLHSLHDVSLISPKVTAILQHVRIS